MNSKPTDLNQCKSLSMLSALGASNNNSEATSGGNVACIRHSVLWSRLADSTEWRKQAMGPAQLLVVYCRVSGYYKSQCMTLLEGLWIQQSTTFYHKRAFSKYSCEFDELTDGRGQSKLSFS